MRIKKGDKVIVIAGKEKGKVGVILQTLPNKNRVIVEEVNLITKHVKPTQEKPDGGIEKMEGPIHVSNVMLVVEDGKDGVKASRTRIEVRDGKAGKEKVRVTSKTGVEI